MEEEGREGERGRERKILFYYNKLKPSCYFCNLLKAEERGRNVPVL